MITAEVPVAVTLRWGCVQVSHDGSDVIGDITQSAPPLGNSWAVNVPVGPRSGPPVGLEQAGPCGATSWRGVWEQSYRKPRGAALGFSLGGGKRVASAGRQGLPSDVDSPQEGDRVVG